MWRTMASWLMVGGIMLVLAGAGKAIADTPAASEPAKPAAADSQPAAAPAGWPPGFLMDIMGPGVKKPMDDLGLRMYGVVETGFTGRLIGGDRVLPGRAYEARRVNNLRLHQLRLILDRPYDATKTFDFGGRVEGMFGGDAMLTHSLGLFDKAGEGKGDAWADLLQLYGQAWFKTGKESGLEVTFGKFLSPMGYESVLPEATPLYSHAYLFTFASPTAHTGVKLNYVLNSQASVYFGVVEGWDVWEDNNHAPSYMVGGALAGTEQIDGHARDNFAWCVMTGPEQPDRVSHNRTAVDLVFTHYHTAALSQTIEGNIGLEEGVPDVGYAKWYGVAHYLTYNLCKYASVTYRTEWFRDQGGSRTGVDGAWYENTLGLNVMPFPDHSVLKNLSFRPELRWDYCSEEAFGGGERHNQLTAGIDMIFKF
ncbi:MAG: outer membrane beta-barrel protein [Planctomycetota bacterium]|nr:outer membrane beta-barrel protein [Planctomycetota bacterium]